MSDKENKKIRVGFLDGGIDKAIKNFAGIEFGEIGEVSDIILQYVPRTHGTAVFGVFYSTLNSLISKNSSKAKSIADATLKVVDFSKYHKMNNNKGLTVGYEIIEKALSSSDILNISLKFELADPTISEIGRVSDQFKQSRQKGTLIVTAAGNQEDYAGLSGHKYISANDTFPQNNLYVFTVGAIYPKNFKRPQNKSITDNPVAKYNLSTPSTAVLLASPGRHVTYNTQSFSHTFNKAGHTVLKKDAKKNKVELPDYIDASGTSLACPEVVAYTAFVKHERPDLNSNNVEHLILAATEKIETDQLINGWETVELNQFLRTVNYNHAESYWNGEKQSVYYEWGLGRVNQDRLAHLVKTWESQNIVEEEIKLQNHTASRDGEYYCYTFDCLTDNKAYVLSLNVENKNVTRQKVDYLSITSPLGTESYIHHPKYSWSLWMEHFDGLQGGMSTLYPNETEYLESPINNHLKNTHFYNEDAKGKWIVKSNVPLEKVSLVMRSIKKTSDDVYRFDDRVLKINNPKTLSDINEGIDTIDVSYYKTGEVEVDLRKDQREIRFMKADGSVAKKVAIAQGAFEKVIPASALVGG